MLKKDDILRGLRKIDAKAKEAGVIVDLSIYGGAATYDAEGHGLVVPRVRGGEERGLG